VTERVRFDLEAREAIKRGFDVLADIAQVTLGPNGGVIAVERIAQRNQSPELLTDVATVSRRLLEIPDVYDNMGTMLARHMAWNVREDVGDGSATALIIGQAILREALKYVAAGHNVMALWRGIKKCQARLQARLEELAQPLEERDRIAAMATAVVGDEQLGRFVEEIFDIVGPKGFVEVREGYGLKSDREYVEGVYWDTGWLSPHFADKGLETQATIEKPYILFTDHKLEKVDDLLPVMNAVRQAGGKALVVVGYAVSGDALNLMVSNNERGTMRMLALSAPRVGDMRRGILEDMAISTGGRVIMEGAGDLVSRAAIEDLGRANLVVCSRSTFTIMGGSGNPQTIRERIRTLQQTRDLLDDKVKRDEVNERVGKLLGGTAILNVGGQTKSEREQRKAKAEDAIRIVRSGLQGGVVPGGGSAYVAALPALAEAELTEEERPALTILQTALLAPIECLAKNAGYDPGPVVVHVNEAGQGWGFDVLQGRVVDMMEANIVDPLPTVRGALAYGTSAATMAMTTDVLIHRSYRDDMPSYNP
jgi:chaperonin GroEL